MRTRVAALREHAARDRRGARPRRRLGRDPVHARGALLPELTDQLSEAAADAGHDAPRLASGAGHDAAMMATITPVAMLFVRCAGGVSHHPGESVRAEDVAVAIDVTTRFVERLAAAQNPSR